LRAGFSDWRTLVKKFRLSEERIISVLRPCDSGRRFRAFNLIDQFNREVLRIAIDTSSPAKPIFRALEELIELRGKLDCYVFETLGEVAA
jgi:hypothetical protein